MTYTDINGKVLREYLVVFKEDFDHSADCFLYRTSRNFSNINELYDVYPDINWAILCNNVILDLWNL